MPEKRGQLGAHRALNSTPSTTQSTARPKEVPPPPKTCAHKNLGNRSVSGLYASDFRPAPSPSVPEPQRCHTDARKGAQACTHPCPLSSPPCVFAWEQWEQWEHRINRGFPRSHSILSSGNSGNKSRGNGRFLHIFGHQSPRSGQNSEPRTFNTAKTPMHLLVHICNFQREGDSRPRPHRAARMASAWHTHKGPCTRMNARAWPGGGVTRPTRPRRTAPGVCDSSVRAPGRAGAA